MVKQTDIFFAVILVQLIYSFGITISVHSLNGMNVNLNSMVSLPNASSIVNTTQKFEEQLQRTRNIPLIDIGALVFYSGNAFIDLIGNFITAIPQMITFLLNVFIQFFPIEPTLAFYLKLFLEASLTIIYIWLLITFILSLFSRMPGMI
jgi:hypothetical protein